MIENHSDRRIKTLKLDNGREYTSKELEAFCKEDGIKRELTTPYNPQQNGVAKRKNRTIMEAVKEMIHDQDLPMHIWDEEARTFLYVQNRLSHSSLGLKSSEEMYIGRKPEAIHLNIFGCPVYAHIPKEKENQVGSFWKEGNICWIL